MLSSILRGWVRAVPLPSGLVPLLQRPAGQTYAWSGASRAAQVLHIAFHLPGKQYAEELQWGVDLEKNAGAKDHALPVPETQEPS
jgi:hypothetical protein